MRRAGRSLVAVAVVALIAVTPSASAQTTIAPDTLHRPQVADLASLPCQLTVSMNTGMLASEGAINEGVARSDARAALGQWHQVLAFHGYAVDFKWLPDTDPGDVVNDNGRAVPRDPDGADILITWATADASAARKVPGGTFVPAFKPGVLGIGGVYASPGKGRSQSFHAGFVSLDTRTVTREGREARVRAIAHELGHALNLGHVRYERALMNPSLKPVDTLTRGDAAGVLDAFRGCRTASSKPYVQTCTREDITKAGKARLRETCTWSDGRQTRRLLKEPASPATG